mmetsp:Transcript_72869/g.115344  ORF Transcript_72869/g.115344 Transcript_72869/m.115344 type:complete len:587 (+) Transcript_72869:46-1806(+)
MMRQRYPISTAPQNDAPVQGTKTSRTPLAIVGVLLAVMLAFAFLQYLGLLTSGDLGAGSGAAGRDAAVFEELRRQSELFGVRLHGGVRVGHQDAVGISQRGIFAHAAIDRKTTIVELPVACAISAAVARARSSYVSAALAANAVANEGGNAASLTSSTLLAITLVELFIHGGFIGKAEVGTSIGNCDGLLRAFVEDLKLHLTKDKGFPQHWGQSNGDPVAEKLELEVLALMNDTEVGLMLAQWHRDTDTLYRQIVDGIGEERATKDGVTRALCDLARIAVNSRAFAVPLPNSLAPTAAKERQPALLPMIDLSNHDLPRPITPLISPHDVKQHSSSRALAAVKATTNGTVNLRLNNAALSGHPISVSYGLHANAKMLVHYGFVTPWVGVLTCLTHARVSLPALDVPDLVVWPTRCVETDTEVEKAIRALRWRELRAAGMLDLPEVRCSNLARAGQVSRWQGCRWNRAPSPRIELATWGALSSVVAHARKRRRDTLSHLAGLRIGPSVAHTVALARAHATQVLDDELVVLEVLADVTEAIGQECGTVRAGGEIEECIARVRKERGLGAQHAGAHALEFGSESGETTIE